MLYCVGNVTAAALTFGMLRGFGWTAGLGADEAEKIVWIQTISAGFGAMVILRSSIFRVRIGKDDVDVGLATVVHQLFAAIEREIDRIEGRHRLDAVDAFAGLKFDEVVTIAPQLCAGALQSLTAEQLERLKTSIGTIRGGLGTEEHKLQLLVLELMNAVGPEIVDSVANLLKRKQTGSTQERF